MGTRPPSSLESLLGRPARSLRVDDRDERAERLRELDAANPFPDLPAIRGPLVVCAKS